MNISQDKPFMISVVVPVRNDPENLNKCLEALYRSCYPHYECIVVDDASTDETILTAKRFPVRIIELQKNRGPAHARNCGAEAARGDIVYFIDADVLVYPDTLLKLAETFATQPQIDAIIGSYDDSPNVASFISQYKNLFHHYVHQNSNERACTFWSGCGAIRRDVFIEAGGFDATFKRPAIEDIELGYRLCNTHHNILLQKNVQVKHLKRWTFWGLLKTDIFDRGIPWTQLMLRDHIFPNDLNARFSQRICIMLAYLLLLSTVIFAAVYRPLLFLPLCLLVIVLLINSHFYHFFVQKRNILFAAMVVPFHLLYYWYSGLSFLLGVFAYVFTKNKSDGVTTPKANPTL